MQEKCRLEILSAAQAEIEEIGSMHLELVGPASSRNITEKLYSALERLVDHPLMGTALEDRDLRERGYRRLVCGNYLCFYRVLEDTVVVYHIADGRSDYKKLFSNLASEAP